jgi:PTH1 family peptidyl-tRNA hydrolase
MIKWINKLFSIEKQKINIPNMKKFLIVGLGNIVQNTIRHNIGFKIVDFLAKKENVTFETVKLGALAKYTFKGRTFFLLKPNTYMNLSGKAVQYWMDKENIPLENIFIITDDLNLLWNSSIKPKGSDGGHNGLKILILF